MMKENSPASPPQNDRTPGSDPNSSAAGPGAEITVVLDRSGSMRSIADDAIGGINAFVDAQRRDNPHARLTLVLFDNLYEVPWRSVPIADVAPLTRDTFVPRGSTALHDAIGRAIGDRRSAQAALPPVDRPQVVIAILTDGLENSSREFDGNRIRQLIGERREDGWEFVFLAADQDAIASARTLNIPQHDAVAFRKNPAGVHRVFATMSAKVTEKSTPRRKRPTRFPKI